MKKLFIYLLLSVLFSSTLFAHEGMWLPILLKKYNIEQMQKDGFKLTAEDIYDVNQASLKDAVVGFVRLSSPFHHFCTGEVISEQGLFLTNHHCGYHAIQAHSSLEHDYLTDGFWAMSKEEELPDEGIGVCFLRRIEDVTDQVYLDIEESMPADIRDSVMQANMRDIEKKAVEGTDYVAKVKPFFSGNQYFMSVYEIFRDVRLVGAPPSAIGKFGGDTDNWMWPRHTGDFSMFRIYANKDNKPADYSKDNVPYRPRKHLDISLNGVQKGDFTMIMGYPGTTEEYLPSYAVTLTTQVVNPIRIKVRTKGLDIMKADMNADPEVRIKYSAKVANMANGWKKWIGENRGLQRLDAINVKQQQEAKFTEWVNQSTERKAEYGNILPEYKKIYKELTPYERTQTYLFETLLGEELVRFSGKFRQLTNLNKESKQEDIDKAKESLKSAAEKFYKDYNLATDKKVFAAFVNFYYSDVATENHPEILKLIATKYKGNIDAFTDYVYSKSMFPHSEKLYAFIDEYSVSKNKKLEKDPVYMLFSQSVDIYYKNIKPVVSKIDYQLKDLNRLYMKGLMESQPNKVFFPDANSTFRIAYGKVDDYIPRDAVEYYYQTSLKGIMEKDNPDIYDYDVPDKLKELYKNKDFGKYADAKGFMPVCFTASNHTTGGNSGSPVLNGNGQLIGINFDRNWEGTMSDIMYDPDMCRNITLDIRYVLFIVDKFAGASHLVDEMTLIKSPAKRFNVNKKELEKLKPEIQE